VHDQLLYFLPDRQIPFVSAKRTNAPLPFSVFSGRRHSCWRTSGRPVWPQICHLGLYPRRGTFTLLLPYADLFWTGVLTVFIGLILASAFSTILVYAQELVPGKVGTIAGLFFGFAFGMGGIGSAALGWLADQTSIDYVFRVCSFLPLIGLLTGFLPDLDRAAAERKF
jgi:MFS transporter, FSR family, fosmidomycin resistance protein